MSDLKRNQVYPLTEEVWNRMSIGDVFCRAGDMGGIFYLKKVTTDRVCASHNRDFSVLDMSSNYSWTLWRNLSFGYVSEPEIAEELD